jgi:hypothetical protein
VDLSGSKRGRRGRRWGESEVVIISGDVIEAVKVTDMWIFLESWVTMTL